jgi:choline dehydrogenase-like flavoprotein
MSLERVDSVDPTEVYDYIICGGGTSGCVIAGRLAEDTDAKILVLEAGPDNADLENVHMAGGWSKNFDSETDWNIVTEPMNSVNDRQVKVSRGRFLGGSSGVNGTLCIRGTKQDYDDWGMDEWTGDKMFGYMAKAETMHEKDWHKADMSVHGTSGPLHIEPHDLAPISERVKESMIDVGLSYHPDMFSTGETPHGCGDVPRTVHQGVRTTAADFVTKGYKRANITIKTEVVVDKILFSNDSGEPTATGVATISKTGKKTEYQAKNEIIVTAGAYCSPAILMRSGLGPAEELKKHGIECRVDLPGVGKNLQDHCLVFVFYEVSEPNLTNDYLAYHDNAIASTYQLYQEKKTGILSTFPFGKSPSSLAISITTDHQASSATRASTTASKTPSFGATPRARRAGTQWAFCRRSPTWSSGTRSSTAARSSTTTSRSTASTRSPCATYCSTSAVAAPLP